MSYIPPHLRVSNSQSKLSPDSLSPSSRRPSIPGRRNRELVPDVTIVKSAYFISRLMVLSCDHVMFTKFEGDTFAHLQQHQLYVLEPAMTDTVKDIHELSLQEHPAKLIVGALQEELKGVLEKFKGFARADSVGRLVPLMWVKFGKVLFHDRSNSLEWNQSFMPKEVEMVSGAGRGLSKTFDNSISKEKFSFLHEFAHKNALQSWSKDRYSIQVSDETRPDTHLWSVCTANFKGDEHISLSSKNSAKSALTMLKVRLSPIRYMTSDVACVGKANDIRLMFYVKEYLTGLSEEELQDLESCFGKASVDHSVKGGLRWPFGSKQSTTGRFKVVGSVHEVTTSVVAGRLRWSLQERNRVEFKASSGRISYEVAVRPVVFHEFCKARKERTLEELMSSIQDVIQQIWKDCIEL